MSTGGSELTPLMLAASNGHEETTRFLLESWVFVWRSVFLYQPIHPRCGIIEVNILKTTWYDISRPACMDPASTLSPSPFPEASNKTVDTPRISSGLGTLRYEQIHFVWAPMAVSLYTSCDRGYSVGVFRTPAVRFPCGEEWGINLIRVQSGPWRLDTADNIFRYIFY